jgi:hypothetical protein
MIRVYVATGDALAVVDRGADGNGVWRAELRLVDLDTHCVAADPLRPERVYCGTFGQGLWRSEDAGRTCEPAGAPRAAGIARVGREGARGDPGASGTPGTPGTPTTTGGANKPGPHAGASDTFAQVMSVAVSAAERHAGAGVVWAGTEPSAIFRSEDGGRTWEERPALRAVPSAPEWSFPPRPWTSHVRWIAPDPVEPERLYAGIEAGGVLRSLDAGRTWEDSKPGAQRDCHTLGTHRLAPGRVYEASGGGFTQSRDGGATWQRDDNGLAWRYLWGLAVDPADPETAVVSASRSARQAHDPASAEATLYRKANGTAWQETRAGLPSPRGTLAYVLATHEAEPGVFYAAPHQGDLYRSTDAGRTWEPLDVRWPAGYHPKNVTGLAVVALS